MRHLASLRSTAETWRGLQRRADDAGALLLLAEEEGDEELLQDVSASVEALARELASRERELMLSGLYDRRSAVVAVHAGAGGTESQDWAEMLLRMYVRWCESHGYGARVVDMTPGEEAGVKSATLEVTGENAFGLLKGERGVHRLVRISPFDASKSRHTSFALVEVMPEAEAEAEIEIKPEDLRIDIFHSAGHGGQNVQKVATAVRVTHLPTGIVVSCQNERSQHRNKETALRVLEARLLEREVERREEERARLKGEHVEAGWGNQIRSYVLHPYKMVKDHRTGHETPDAAGVLDGDLDGFIEAYLKSRMGEE
jgi:peptide chain release factor 2